MDYPNVGHSPFSRRVGDRCVAALGIPAQQPFLGEGQASKILRPPSQRYVLGLGGNKLGPAERIMRCGGNTKMVGVGPTVFAVADPTQSKVGMAYVPAQGTALALSGWFMDGFLKCLMLKFNSSGTPNALRFGGYKPAGYLVGGVTCFGFRMALRSLRLTPGVQPPP